MEARSAQLCPPELTRVHSSPMVVIMRTKRRAIAIGHDGLAAAAACSCRKRRPLLPTQRTRRLRSAATAISARARGRCGGRAAVRGRFRRAAAGEKTLIWHLYQAALAGRDIFYDQRYAHSLEMRDVLEGDPHASGRRRRPTLAEIQRYTKLFWINTGPLQQPHRTQVRARMHARSVRRGGPCRRRGSGARFPLDPAKTLDQLLARLQPDVFRSRRRSDGHGEDAARRQGHPHRERQQSLRRRHDEGRREFQRAIPAELPAREARTARWSRRSYRRRRPVRPPDRGHRRTPRGRRSRSPPSRWPRRCGRSSRSTGPAKRRDREAYDIAWVQDKASPVDTINGFIEVYLDARGIKGAWEALVFYVNREKTSDIQKLAREAQWFEDRMPWDPQLPEAGRQGITANAIDVVIETGDSGPVTPVGINLPNDQTCANATAASRCRCRTSARRTTSPRCRSSAREFSWTPEEAERATTLERLLPAS